MEKSYAPQSKNIDDGKKIISLQLEEDVFSLRGISPKRLRFEIEYALERGTTSNSFIFKKQKVAGNSLNEVILVHPLGGTFKDLFIKSLEKIIPKITTLNVVVGHVNPNRVELLKRLAEVYPNTKLICSNPAAKLLKEIWNRQKPSKETQKKQKEGEGIPMPSIEIIKDIVSIDLLNGSELKLLPTPSARWPGGLMAFEESLGLLMSDKFFGAHICTEEWAERNRSETEEERRHYFDCLMAPMTSQIDSIISHLEELDIRTVAPSHGPAIESSWRSLLNDYQRWGERQEFSSIKVALLFASAYGNTASIADALARGINKTGVKVESLNCEFSSPNDLLNAIKEAHAYLIGSPTIGGHAPTPIVSTLGTLLSEGDRKNPVGIFGSYGWSGEALDLLEKKLRDGGFEFGFKPIKINFSPDTNMIRELEETGTIFARKLLQKQKRARRKATGGMAGSSSDPTVLALGRIIGSLCVLTTRKITGNNYLNGAMVASWVSQASFTPPGLTIAVSKDRAVEALLHTGDRFILNILADGKQNHLLRQFLQPFAAGEDRLSGIEIEESPAGQPILKEGMAWLEGNIKQRMECGDHWLIYAEIECGKVLDNEGVTAVHHRRTGENY